MPIASNLDTLLEHLPERHGLRPGLLALDVSKRAIGVAGADPTWRIATPLTTIRRRRWAQDVEAIARVVREREAKALVIGWPLNMDGSEGPRCQAVRAFAQNLDAALDVPMLLWDERLSTFAAEDLADQAGLRGPKRAEIMDALAAATILQDLLDTIARRERSTRDRSEPRERGGRVSRREG